MTSFDPAFFQKMHYSKKQIDQILKKAERDLSIASKDPYIEVRFTYSYQALIKASIALIAHVGRAKVRSVPGHHIKTLEKASEILQYPDLYIVGNAMRMKRNDDLYGAGEIIGKKEAEEYLIFVEDVLRRVKENVA